MKHLYLTWLLLSIFCCAMAQNNEQKKLKNGHYPVVVKVSVADSNGILVKADVWVEKAETQEKFIFETVGKGKYIQVFTSEKPEKYILYAQLDEQVQQQEVTIDGTSEEQKILNKNFILNPKYISQNPSSPFEPVTLHIQIFDDKAELVDGEITIVDLNDKKIEGVKRIAKGKYQIQFFNKKAEDYNVSIAENGFLYENIMVYIPAATEKPQDFTEQFKVKVTSQPETEEPKILTSPRVGQRVRLRHVFFEKGSNTLQSESFAELDKLVNLMQEHPSMKVEIAGHTDNVGDPYTNKMLSQQRAESVLSYLVGKGVQANRLTAVGYGQERPIASNDDEKDGRELNRRTEFTILEM